MIKVKEIDLKHFIHNYQIKFCNFIIRNQMHFLVFQLSHSIMIVLI
jgi:hypothetical protein